MVAGLYLTYATGIELLPNHQKVSKQSQDYSAHLPELQSRFLGES